MRTWHVTRRQDEEMRFGPAARLQLCLQRVDFERRGGPEMSETMMIFYFFEKPRRRPSGRESDAAAAARKTNPTALRRKRENPNRLPQIE